MSRTKDIYMYVLGGLISVGFFFVLVLLIYKPMPSDNRDIFYLIVGALISFEGVIINYFYGSSRGSAEKSEMLKQ